MQSDFSEKFSAIIEKKRLKVKLENDLQAVKDETKEKSTQLSDLEARLKKEKVDVERLEHISLTKLFHTVLGSREEQLEKERQELLTAELQYQFARRQVDALVQEQDLLQRRLLQLQSLDAEYTVVLAEKEQFLRQSCPAVAGELISIAEQIAHLNAEAKELNEAIDAGKDALADLKDVIESLKKAENWGTWDLLGGGMISDIAKYSNIDAARSGMEAVQFKMNRFKRELADVREQIDLQINIGSFESFADYFFDGLIADWVVRERISESLEHATNGASLLVQTINKLIGLKKANRSQVVELEAKRNRMIEQA